MSFQCKTMPQALQIPRSFVGHTRRGAFWLRMTKTSAGRSIVNNTHTAVLSFFALMTNGVKTRLLYSVVSWRDTQTAFLTDLLSLRLSRYGLPAGRSERVGVGLILDRTDREHG